MGHPYAFKATMRTLCVFIYKGPSKALIWQQQNDNIQEGHEPSQSYGRMSIWGHCELLYIPGFQEKLKNRRKSCCVRPLKKCAQLSFL